MRWEDFHFKSFVFLIFGVPALAEARAPEHDQDNERHGKPRRVFFKEGWRRSNVVQIKPDPVRNEPLTNLTRTSPVNDFMLAQGSRGWWHAIGPVISQSGPAEFLHLFRPRMRYCSFHSELMNCSSSLHLLCRHESSHPRQAGCHRSASDRYYPSNQSQQWRQQSRFRSTGMRSQSSSGRSPTSTGYRAHGVMWPNRSTPQSFQIG